MEEDITPSSPVRHRNQGSRVSDGSIEAELLSFRAHLGRTQRKRDVGTAFERGARELLAFLAASGQPLSAFTAADLIAFKASIDAREGTDQSGRRRARVIVEGARAYLRFKASEGKLAQDEALFFALSPRLTRGVKGSTEGDGEHAVLLREVGNFGLALAASGLTRVRRRAYERAAVRLLFFLARMGKGVDEITPEDWARFQDEVKTKSPRIAGLVKTGARAYLRMKGQDGVEREQLVAGLTRGGARDLIAFKDRLAASHGDGLVREYTWGARELLVFLEGQGKTAAAMTAGDLVALSEDLRARAARGELASSRLVSLLCGARHYLREKAEAGEVKDVALIEAVSPLNNRRLHGLLSAVSPDEARVAREVEEYRKARFSLGYSDSSPQQRGARRLLRYLAGQGRRLTEITREDWQDFKREVLSEGRVYSKGHPILVGAASYLRMKARQGVIGDDQVPQAIVHKAPPPDLPPSLGPWLLVLDEAMAAQDFALPTRRSYRRAFRDFLLWLAEVAGILDLTSVTREVVTAYRLQVQAQPSSKGTPYAIETQIGILTSLRFFFSWLVKTGRLLADPTLHLPQPRRPQRLPRSLKVTEVARLIASLPQTVLGLRDRALLELLYGTGMRRAEAAQLRLDDVDLEQRTILIRLGKGRKDRVVPLGKKAKQVLLDYLEQARPQLLRGKGEGRAVFVGRRGERLSEGQVTQRVIELGRKVQLKLGPHLLRHSCATHLLRGRADIRHIQRLLGHQSLATTERYTRVEVQDLRKVIERCHPREKKPSRP